MNPGLFVYVLLAVEINCPNMLSQELPPIYEIVPQASFDEDTFKRAQQYKDNGFIGIKKVNGVYDVLINTDSGDGSCDDKTIAYFTDDVALSKSYYDFYITFSDCLDGGFRDNGRCSESYLFFHQQLAALFYAHRLSFDLGHIQSQENCDDINSYEARLLAAIDSGFFSLLGFLIIEILIYIEACNRHMDNLMVSNSNHLDSICNLFSNQIEMNCEPKTKNIPNNVIFKPQNALRDISYWILMDKFSRIYKKVTDSQKPYAYKEINFDGVRIESIDVGPLITYHDFIDADISNGVDNECFYDRKRTDFVIKVRQCRLNHSPFEVNISIVSLNAVPSIVRIFLGPKFDESGRIIELNENRFNFVFLDQFEHDLVVGPNRITRNSKDFFSYYDLIESTKSGKVSGINSNGSFNRLLLPKGKLNGQDYILFVHISPDHSSELPDHSSEKSQFEDAYRFGYPLNRRIDTQNWYTSNMFYRDVTIFHKD